MQRLKSALGQRSPKTVNNALTVLSVMLKTAAEWGIIGRVPCSIKLLKTPKSTAAFHDFDEYERLVDSARTDVQAHLVVLGGEAGLRCRVRRFRPAPVSTSKTLQQRQVSGNERLLLCAPPALDLSLALECCDRGRKCF